MDNIQKQKNIDPLNKIEKEVNGCKVRLFFSLTPNERMEHIILENLMLVFERRIKTTLSNV